ncbi:MAG: hypothetical protein VB042_05285 [Victivallaceae bacterium]|nr:hypothetical protein [Victivallaceae bacterium]
MNEFAKGRISAATEIIDAVAMDTAVNTATKIIRDEVAADESAPRLIVLHCNTRREAAPEAPAAEPEPEKSVAVQHSEENNSVVSQHSEDEPQELTAAVFDRPDCPDWAIEAGIRLCDNTAYWLSGSPEHPVQAIPGKWLAGAAGTFIPRPVPQTPAAEVGKSVAPQHSEEEAAEESPVEPTDAEVPPAPDRLPDWATEKALCTVKTKRSDFTARLFFNGTNNPQRQIVLVGVHVNASVDFADEQELLDAIGAGLVKPYELDDQLPALRAKMQRIIDRDKISTVAGVIDAVPELMIMSTFAKVIGTGPKSMRYLRKGTVTPCIDKRVRETFRLYNPEAAE